HKFANHVTDVTILNCYNIYLVKTGNKKLKLREFQYNLVYQLLEKYGEIQTSEKGKRMTYPPERLQAKNFISRHYLDANETVNGRKVQRACYVCQNTVREPKKRKMVSTKCVECDIPMCLGSCFKNFHTMKKY
ncbi:unnamed protein product, partial [Meganyctiphanes norvegica]